MLLALCGLVCLGANCVGAADTLVWRPRQSEFDANIKATSLTNILRRIKAATGWDVVYEPVAAPAVSVKFKGLPENDALRRLLGKLNFAKEVTNGITRLRVFQTASSAATQIIIAEKKDYLIRNELLVKLKHNAPGAIEELAAKLHAKIVGRDDRIGLYRLQFDDEAAANSALQSLSADDSPAVAAHNYIVDPPNPSQFGPSSGGPPNPASLINPKAPADGGLVVGLIDTGIQSLDGLDKYMLKPISVVGQADIPTDTPSHATGMFETMLQAMSDSPSMIQPVVIYKDGEETTTYQLMEGILAAVNSGANPINLSLGGTGAPTAADGTDMLHSLIQAATQKGVVFVAASGNDPGGGPTYPAAYPEVLSVTALAPNGQLASYADNFPGVKSSAPGTSYVSYGGQMWVFTGTSGSTAWTTGGIVEQYNQTHAPLSQIVAQWGQLHPAPR